MKEVFLKFLETQNLSTIITEIVAFFSAWQLWKKYTDQQKTRKKAFLKALSSSEDVVTVLKELQESYKDKKIIPCLAEVTNGGGIPKADKPLYIRAINSTNSEILDLWGKKTLVVSNLNKAIIKLVNNGFSYLDIDKFHLKKVEFWAGAKHIERVHYFIVGYSKKAITVLAINTDSKADLSDEEYMIAQTFASRIKSKANQRKKFWEHKIQ